MQEQNEQFFCPSFSTYSSDKLSELAGRVSAQYDDDNDDDKDDNSRFDADDFEFSLVQDDSANEIIIEGKIHPIFPIFNRDLLVEDLVRDSMENENSMQSKIKSSVRLPLNMFVENEAASASASCSSSEADELETVAPGTYCVWRPKIVESNKCKKSNSTGSTPKRWSFLNLLRRSNSEGKDSLVFLTPKNRGKSGNNDKVENLKARRNSDVVQVAGKVKPKGVSGGDKSSSSAHEAFYVQNRAMKEGYKRKSYLPYRQDLVGFFANVGALGPAAKAFPPF